MARQSGVPLEPLRRWAEERRDQHPASPAVIEPDRELVPGVEVETDHGAWSVHETPGHAPSHVVLFQPEQRLLLSGDHLLGRVSLYFDYGWTPDPVAEFLAEPRHGRARSTRGSAYRATAGRSPTCGRTSRRTARRSQERLEATLERARRARGDRLRAGPEVFGEFDRTMMSWALTIMLCFLTHLERAGRVGARQVD